MAGTFIAGFALSFGLILAIGAQNAFVLRQGLRREHVFAVCLTCALSDAILIAAGVAGFGALARSVPWLEEAMRYGGAGFLVLYGARSLWAARRSGQTLAATGGATRPLRSTLLTVMALTWLNPHVYLDTLALIGSVSAQYRDPLSFGLGAIAASFTFFFMLGYGARLLAPAFSRPRSWQVLEVAIAGVMWAIAGKLLFL